MGIKKGDQERQDRNSVYRCRRKEKPIYGGGKKTIIRAKGRLFPKKGGLSTVFNKLSTPLGSHPTTGERLELGSKA